MDPVVDGEAFFMVTGLNGRPWLWPEKQYEAHAEGRGSEIAPTEANLLFDHLTFAFAVKLEIDKQGRVLIPEKNLREYGIEKEITLASVRDHLEVWERAAWLSWRKELEQKRAEIIAGANQNRTKRLETEGPESLLSRLR